MGYNTIFFGELQLDRKLSAAHQEYLTRFSCTRRMRRVDTLLRNEADPWRVAAGLPLGPDGAYFVGSSEEYGQDYNHISVVDSDAPPRGQPGLWCHWAPRGDGSAIAWNGQEKFYDYDLWLEYLIAHFLGPWGYTLEGTLRWLGEDVDDQGTIYVANNEVFVLPDRELEEILEADAPKHLRCT